MMCWVMHCASIDNTIPIEHRIGPKTIITPVELEPRGIPPDSSKEMKFGVIVSIAREEGVFLSHSDWISPNAILRIWYE